MVLSLVAIFSPSRLIGARSETLPLLEYPLTPAPRVIVLGRRMRRSQGIVSMPKWRFRPRKLSSAEALAATREDLMEVAELMHQGQLTLKRLNFPLIVFSSPQAGCLTAADHHWLWDTFRVPVFEQMRDTENKLIAFECEARHGFHLATSNVEIPGAQPLTGICACGAEGPRVQIPERRV